MKDSEKGKFENAWHQAFENAEHAPSEDVWAGVEQGLNKAETATMKRRVLFYQRLAAASILFALLLGGLSTYYISDLKNQRMTSQAGENRVNSSDFTDADNETTKLAKPEKGIAIDNLNQRDGFSSVDIASVVVDNKSNSYISENTTDRIVSSINKNEQGSILNIDFTSKEPQKRMINRSYPSLLSSIPEPSVELEGVMREVTIVRILPAMPSSFMNTKRDKKSKENLWASLGASTGNYSPSSNLTSVSSSQVLNQNSGGLYDARAAYSTTSSKGSAFSVGMNLGKRISSHWILQGGVSYLNQAIGYTSNFAVLDAGNTLKASVADYASLGANSSFLPVSSPYQVNSVNESISVPLQAGYLLIDRKIGLQLNSGVSTDIFIQNRLTDQSGQLASYSSGAGDTSPYRTLSWSGLMGTELSYRLGTQYRISMVPGLRYSLNSVLKSESTPSNPLVWDVGFRFRYIFK